MLDISPPETNSNNRAKPILSYLPQICVCVHYLSYHLSGDNYRSDLCWRKSQHMTKKHWARWVWAVHGGIYYPVADSGSRTLVHYRSLQIILKISAADTRGNGENRWRMTWEPAANWRWIDRGGHERTWEDFTAFAVILLCPQRFHRQSASNRFALLM